MYLKPNAPTAASAGKSVIGFNVVGGREVEGDLGLVESRSAVDRRDLVGMFPDSGEKDVARAAKAAAEALPAWAAVPPAERRAIALRASEVLERHRDKLARIIIREIGMTAGEAQAEVQDAIAVCAWFASPGAGGPNRPPLSGRALRRPGGVCGLLATGASPLAAPARKILPAILGGNTVVWKPSDNAPTAAYLMLRALMEAGLPAGVVNTVNGRGRTGCGKHMLGGIEKGHYQAFSFVGSAALGATVAELCGRHLLPADLDLAGKGTLIVMPDADLDRAAQDALKAAYRQAGQHPVGLSNLLVHEACAKAFRQRLLAGLEALPVGNPLSEPGVAMGPLMNTRVATSFRDIRNAGHEDGAALLAGGEAWSEGNRTAQVKGDIGHGAYLQPCLWEGVTPAMALFRQQAPGPSLNLCTVRDFEEAMAWTALAPSRVAGSLYAQDRALLARFAREVRTDLVGFNHLAGEGHGRLSLTGLGTRPGLQPAFDAFTRWQVLEGDGFEEAANEAPSPAPASGSFHTDWDSL